MSMQTMPSTSNISEALSLLVGKNAWGLRRSHGSMFFLELGQPAHNNNQKHVHGEWHFLFELCHWRIHSHGTVVVGSEDEQDFIDQAFNALSLGEITQAWLDDCNDLELIFNSDFILNTFSTSAAERADWTQWLFFTPGDIAWKKTAFGIPTSRNIHEA